MRVSSYFVVAIPIKGSSVLKFQIVAAMVGVGGLFVSGCVSSHRPTLRTPAVVKPVGTIRSQSDLKRYLSATETSGSPLSALSSGGRERFLSSITFGAKGISGFRYAELQSELTASQIYDVLALFGAQKDVAIIPNVRAETVADRRVITRVATVSQHGGGRDYRDYRCASRATCSTSPGDICTSHC
jgi:hypothetical protein